MSKEKNSSLIEIRDMLKEEMDKFTAINNEIIDNQSDFEKITDNYNKYNSLVDKGRSHITDLKKQEFFENLFIYIGFYFYLGCVVYVLSKRFPIHKILMFFIKLLYKIVKFFFKAIKEDENDISSSIGTINNLTNITLVNKTLQNTTVLNKTVLFNTFRYKIFLNQTLLKKIVQSIYTCSIDLK